MEKQATQHFHSLQPSAQSVEILVNICDKNGCTACGERMTIQEATLLKKRPIVAKFTGLGWELFMCTHCTYHHTRVIPEKHRLHWDLDGKWSNVGAPLNIETARAFCRMLGDTEQTYLVVIVL